MNAGRRTTVPPEKAPPALTVLIVGFSDSVHAARWVRMLLGRGLRLVFLSVYEVGYLSPAFGKMIAVSSAEDLLALTDQDIGLFDLASVSPSEIEELEAGVTYEPWQPAWIAEAKFASPAHVVAAVKRLRPDIVHSMVVQFGGYLCAASKALLGDAFPRWLLSNWGSDIFLYRMQPDHRDRIMAMLSMIDGYHSECTRDAGIARQLGFRGHLFPSIPASGGMDFAACPTLNALRPSQERTEIVIKGYHGWAGRGLHILAAVHLAADILRRFRIRIVLAGPAVREMASAIADQDGLEISCDPYLNDHGDALARLGNARIVVGLGISDGISTTLLEAMAVGTFPIQGDRSCGGEWIVPGETGLLVSPHDPASLADAITRAVNDDAMVQDAAQRNRVVVEKRWNSSINGAVAADSYRSLLAPPELPSPMPGHRDAVRGKQHA